MSISSLVLALASSAAEAPPRAEIVITGRAIEDDEGEALRAIVKLDRTVIESVPSRRLEDVLQQVAGVQTFRRAGSRSAHPTSGGLTMRGLGGNAASRALLIVDGVPQQDPFGGWIDFPAVLVDLAGEVIVTRGGGSGRWGPGALAGTIEVDTLEPGTANGLVATLRAGSRRAIEGRARWMGQGSKSYLLAGAVISRGNGFIPIVESDRGAADIPAPYNQRSARVRGGIAIAPEVELQAGLSFIDDRRARGLRDSDNRTLAGDQSLRLVGRGAIPFALTLFAQQRRFESQFAATNPGRASSRQTLDQYRVPSTGHGLRAEVAPIFGGLRLRAGGDLRFGSGETRELFAFSGGQPTRSRIAGGDFRTFGIFGEASWRFGAANFEAAARLDRWRLGVGKVREAALAGEVLRVDRFGPRSGIEPGFRLGSGLAISPKTALRAAVYRGWRLPTLNELYRPFRIGLDAVAANPGLRPEVLRGGELGMVVSPTRELSLSLTGFAARLDGAIANVVLARGPGQFPGVGFVASGGQYLQRLNLDSIDSGGVELDTQWSADLWDARLSASWSRSRVRAKGAGAALDGRPPPQTPALTLAGSGGWRGARGQHVAITMRFVSRQFEDSLARKPLRKALTFGGVAAWPVTRRIQVNASVENLFNARIETGIGSDGAVERAEPRTFWIGLSLSSPRSGNSR